MGSCHKKYRISGFLCGSILCSTFFMLYINDPLDVVIGNITVYANDTSLL